jgi:iron complex outermembrane receptor protein
VVVPRTIRRLVFFLILPVAALAQTSAGEVSGTVKDSTGAVLVGAQVSLRSGSGQTLQTVTTDAQGRYHFSAVAAASYLLFVYQDHFTPLTEELKVDSTPLMHDVTLSPASFSEEVTVSFTGEQARTAIKMDAPVRDIPLTVKSYTSSFVKALDVTNTSDMYTYMNGVNRTGDGFSDTAIRGITNNNQDANNMQVNGLPGFTSRFNAPSISNVERIEVLKGPASVLYGRANPGGLVNIITKKPLGQRQNQIELRAGTWGGGNGPGFGDSSSYRGGVDFTGPVGGNNKRLYRFIASYDDNGSFRDFVRNKDLLVAPSFSFLAERTIVTFEGEYRHNDGNLDQGLLAPQNDIHFVAPIHVRYQEPDDFANNTGWAGAGYLTRSFASGLVLNATWRSVIQKDQRVGFENNRVEADNRRVRRRDRDQVSHRQNHFLDATLTDTYNTGSMVHHLLLGFGGGYGNRDLDRRRFGNLGFFVDIYNPVYGLAVRPANGQPGTHQDLDLWSYNAYAQDRVDFSAKWKGLLSLRYDRLDTDSTELRLPDPPRSRSDDAFVPTVGLVFEPDSRWSLYASYASSFDPQAVTALDATGRNTFDPERGRQFEAGVKADLFERKVEATLSAFDVVRTNVLIDIEGGAFEQVGEETSDGVELDLRVQPTAGLQTILGYTYTNARLTGDRPLATRPDRTGARLINSAKNAFNVWLRYDLGRAGAFNGLGLGLGLIYRGDRPGTLPAAVVRGDPVPGQPISSRVIDLPAYFRADAGLYYVKPRYELTLRINNVFDELYYESAFNSIQIRPGRPRELTLSLRTRF